MFHRNLKQTNLVDQNGGRGKFELHCLDSGKNCFSFFVIFSRNINVSLCCLNFSSWFSLSARSETAVSFPGSHPKGFWKRLLFGKLDQGTKKNYCECPLACQLVNLTTLVLLFDHLNNSALNSHSIQLNVILTMILPSAQPMVNKKDFGEDYGENNVLKFDIIILKIEYCIRR